MKNYVNDTRIDATVVACSLTRESGNGVNFAI